MSWAVRHSVLHVLNMCPVQRKKMMSQEAEVTLVVEGYGFYGYQRLGSVGVRLGE